MSNGNPNKKRDGTDFWPEFGFWPSRSGNGSYSVMITKEVLAVISKAKENGVLLLKEVPDSVRDKNDRLPHYRVTICPPSERSNQQQEQSADDSL